VAAGVIVESFRVLLAVPQAQPGLVVCVHTYGNAAKYHPHLHVMSTDGAFSPEGVFHALPTMSLAPMEELFRHRVFKMLMKKGLLNAERVKLMESWEHSGFNIDASVGIGADDATGRENLARYLIRAPFSGEKITYNAAESMVIYETKRGTGANGNYETFDPLDFLAAVTSHIPNRSEHLVRYYSHYSSVQRSRRRRQGLEKQPLGPIPIALSDDTASAKTARGNWARFIKKVFEIDPLLCPDCGGVMKIISFIDNQKVIRAILLHLALWDVPRPRPPPVAAGGHTDFEYVPYED